MKLVAFVNPSRNIVDPNIQLVAKGFHASSPAEGGTSLQLRVVFDLREPPTYAQCEFLHTLLFHEQRILGYHLYDNDGHLLYKNESPAISLSWRAIDTCPPRRIASSLGVAFGLWPQD